MTSSESERQKISAELKRLSLKRQQLLEKKKIKCVLQELRNYPEFGQTEGKASRQHDIDGIDDELRQVIERKAELQKSLDSTVNAKDENSKKEVSFISSHIDPAYVEAPPTFPAPTVILDLEKLPMCPCRTQCPECGQFILTETFTSVSSLTWLICFMTASIGCVAGCCLIPFCLNTFKSITHRCPKCRATIRTIERP